VRAEIEFQDRCSFPLTLKTYIIGQQEKDSVPEWVPDDFLDPDAAMVRQCGALSVWVVGRVGGGWVGGGGWL